MRYANCVSRLTGCNLGLHVKGDLLNCTCKWQQVQEWRTTKMFSWTYYTYSVCLWQFWSGTARDTADRLGDWRAKVGHGPRRDGLRHRKTAAEAGRGNISNLPHSSHRSTRKATVEVDCGGFVDPRTFFSLDSWAAVSAVVYVIMPEVQFHQGVPESQRACAGSARVFHFSCIHSRVRAGGTERGMLSDRKNPIIAYLNC